MAKPLIEHSRLLALLHYDPDTGVFTQKHAWWNRLPGDRPGGKTPQGYWYIGIERNQYPAHRLAWFYVHGRWPEGDIDHINGDRMDNRLCNLREATRSRNLHNTTCTKANSGVRGVSWIARDKRWVATIRVDYKVHRLGRFHTKEAAVAARKAAEQRLVSAPDLAGNLFG